MIEQIVRANELPWLPHPQATDLDVWDSHGVPTLGTYELNKTRVLFVAADLREPMGSSWAYLPLTDHQVAELDAVEFDSVADLYTFIREYFAGKAVVVAGVRNGKITTWNNFETEDTPVGLLKVIVDHLRAVCKAYENEINDLQKKRKEKEVTEKLSELSALMGLFDEQIQDGNVRIKALVNS